MFSCWEKSLTPALSSICILRHCLLLCFQKKVPDWVYLVALNPDIGLCTERSIECVFLERRYNCSVSELSHWDSHDPLLDFCTITKAFLCWICLGVTHHHTYLSTACVLPGSCLILNALHQKHSSPVKQYTCMPRYTSLILFSPHCPIYIPSTAPLMRRENKLLESLQPRII